MKKIAKSTAPKGHLELNLQVRMVNINLKNRIELALKDN